MGQPLPQHGEGATRAALFGHGFPEGHEWLVREGEAILRAERSEVEDVLVVGQQLLGFGGRGTKGGQSFGMEAQVHRVSLA
jgi:hypothetical protein